MYDITAINYGERHKNNERKHSHMNLDLWCLMLCVMRTWWRGCAVWLPGVKINMFAFCLCFPSRPFSCSCNNHNHQGSVTSPVVTPTRYFSSGPAAPKSRVWMSGGLNLWKIGKTLRDSNIQRSAEGISLVLPFYHNAIWCLSEGDIGEHEGLQFTPSIEPFKKEQHLITQPLTMLL